MAARKKTGGASSPSFIQNHFTYSEFLNYVAVTPRIEGNGNSSEDKDEDWTGTKSLEEALKFANEGWDEGIKKIKKIQNLINKAQAVEQVEVMNVCGAYVDVPTFLSGVPDCFVDYETVEATKFIKLWIDMSAGGQVTVEQFLNYSNSVISIIDKLESDGYRVELNSFMAANLDESNTKSLTVIKIKNYSESVNINTIAFAFHPSFLRRLWLKWQETTNVWQAQYGHVLKTLEDFDIPSDAVVMPRLRENYTKTSAEITKEFIKKIEGAN